MTDVWLPGAHQDPGVNAGYNAGRSQMLRTVAHYTVGADSRSIARRGYFHFLVHQDESREGGCTQYAEIDAVTWHAAAQGNPYGPGVEFERLVTGGLNDEGLSEAQPLTVNQIEWGSRIVEFCAEWGIPAVLYDGPRFGGDVMPGGGFAGWVNHQAIDRDRSDGLLRAEWSLLTAAAPPAPAPAPKKSEEEEEAMYVSPEGNPNDLYVTNQVHRRKISPEEWAHVRDLARFFGEPDPPIWPLAQAVLDSIPIAK